jgi:hypothetical protein
VLFAVVAKTLSVHQLLTFFFSPEKKKTRAIELAVGGFLNLFSR